MASKLIPAMVTPFDEKGRIDSPSVARLLARFESAGCDGVVVAGTNGEGPSLSAPEKRDLLETVANLRKPGFEVVLGIASNALTEAVWLCRQAGQTGADGVLLMAPSYFREASEDGISGYFHAVLDASPVPILVYNLPQRTGITLTPALVATLAQHENFAGLKDSSGDEANLDAYRAATRPTHKLYVGDERLLHRAIDAGWSGTISGVANVIPQWLRQVLGEAFDATKFELVLPVLDALRACPQPGTSKALLADWGIIPNGAPRLPLLAPDPTQVAQIDALIEGRLGRLAKVPA